MQVAVNAVESFKRARLVDSVTLDDDKVAPIYKLDEVCELLNASSSDVVREIVQYLVKSRLEHRSPFVKQKVSGVSRLAMSWSFLDSIFFFFEMYVGPKAYQIPCSKSWKRVQARNTTPFSSRAQFVSVQGST